MTDELLALMVLSLAAFATYWLGFAVVLSKTRIKTVKQVLVDVFFWPYYRAWVWKDDGKLVIRFWAVLTLLLSLSAIVAGVWIQILINNAVESIWL